ncbi:membrane protein of ER body 2-like [Cajanus cajan]|uniref:membrane protein of ER body 2-like n=1 Tax=Cajanus cajan TaxID=3821 RepID=UPI00098DD032|nr:membrane protein of ER body 2-like [Cajanus cajan]
MEVTLTPSNEAENEVEEVGLQRRRHLQLSSTNASASNSNEDIQVKGGGIEFDESETKEKFDIIRTEVYTETILKHEETENITILPASDDLPLPQYSTSKNVTSEIVTVGTMKENKERQELYLERVFEIPPTHGFYCPNCKSCIQKVYIQKGEWEQINAPIQPLQPIEQIRCSSCFTFLIPIGSWFFSGLASDESDASKDQGTSKSAIKIADDKGKQSLQATEKEALPGLEPQNVATEVEDKTDSSEKSDWRVITIPKQPDIQILDEKQDEHVEVKIDEVDTGAGAGAAAEVVTTESTALITTTVTASSKTLEILKSIVYGGLLESLASLSVVTSAASADATTLNIVALAIANLIGGLFVLAHNLNEMISEEPKRAENDTDAAVDQYNELLGPRKNFTLHAFIAIFSFIIFGLVAPVVYGFSFDERDEN